MGERENTAAAVVAERDADRIIEAQLRERYVGY